MRLAATTTTAALAILSLTSAQPGTPSASSSIKHIQLAYLHDKMVDDVSGENNAILHHERRLQSINPAQIAQVSGRKEGKGREHG